MNTQTGLRMIVGGALTLVVVTSKAADPWVWS